MTTKEVSEVVGDCDTRSWQRWEKGQRKVPLHITQSMQKLALARLELLKSKGAKTDVNCRYFEEYEEYLEAGGDGNVLKWRIAQSVGAALLCERDAVNWRL